MAPTFVVASVAHLTRRAGCAVVARVLLLAAIVLGPLPAASQAWAQQQVAAPFPRSAAFLPAQTGFYAAVNLAPDPTQRATLDRLFNYYMQDPDFASSWSGAWESMVPGMTGDQLRAGMASWIGSEAFIAIPSPGGFGQMMGGAGMMSPSDIPFLGGVGVRDAAALMGFVLSVGSSMGSGRPTGPDDEGDGQSAQMTTTLRNGITVMTIPVSRNGPPLYVALPSGFMLFSANDQILFDALDRQPTGSLASNVGFQEVMRTSQQAPLAVIYSDSPGLGMPAVPGAPTITTDLTAWTGATIRLDTQGLRLDQVSAFNTDKLTPAMRAFATAPANPFQSARLVPRDSSVLLAITHLDLIWAAVHDIMATSPDMADSIGEYSILFRANTGLDLDRDVFGWMTGEAAGFVSPGGAEAPAGIGGGLVIQAADAATAQARVGAVVDAISRSAPQDMAIDQVAIGGATFNRIQSVMSPDDFSLYLGTVGPWVVATDAEAVAAGIVGRATNQNDQGLSGDPAFTALRTGMPNPSQSLVYVDITSLAETIIAAASPRADDAAQARFYLAPFKRLIMGGASSAERSHTSMVLQIAVP